MVLFRKIDAASADSISSGFNFFKIDDTDVSLSHSNFVEKLTLNPVGQPPYHFKIQEGSNYLDLSKTYILVEMKMEKKVGAGDWENTETADNISTVQAPGLTFMKNLKVGMFGREVYNSRGLQAYKNYIDITLNANPDVKNSYLSVAGYYEDPDSQISGAGWEARRELFTDGKIAQFVTKLNFDLSNQDRFIVSNTEIDIEIQPHDSNFMIVAPHIAADTQARLTITNIKLYVKILDAMDGLSLSIARLLEKQPARYPLKSSVLKSQSFITGTREANFNVFTKEIPSQIVCMMTQTDHFNGTVSTSPLQANHFHITDFRMLWNGQQTPSVPYELDFDNGKVARAYHDLYENTGLAWSPHTSGITLGKFMNGWTFFVFNLTPNLENNSNFNLLQEGVLSTQIRFSQPLPAGMTMIFYATYDSILNIDKNRLVTTDVTI